MAHSSLCFVGGGRGGGKTAIRLFVERSLNPGGVKEKEKKKRKRKMEYERNNNGSNDLKKKEKKKRGKKR